MVVARNIETEINFEIENDVLRTRLSGSKKTQIWLVEDNNERKKYVEKINFLAAHDDVSFYALNEYENMRALEGCKHVAKVWDYNDGFEDRIKFSMEVLEPQGNIRNPFASIVQLCEALEELETEGFLHRDLKPGNFGYNRNGVLKLIDFEYSKRLQEPEFIKPGFTFGTLGYASPEQLRGEPTNYKSDLISVAFTSYGILKGNSPLVYNSNEPRTALYARNRGYDKAALDVIKNDLIKDGYSKDFVDAFALAADPIQSAREREPLKQVSLEMLARTRDIKNWRTSVESGEIFTN